MNLNPAMELINCRICRNDWEMPAAEPQNAETHTQNMAWEGECCGSDWNPNHRLDGAYSVALSLPDLMPSVSPRLHLVCASP